MPQILRGIFGLAIEAEVPIPEISHFLNVVGDDQLQTMFSEITRDEGFSQNLPVLQDQNQYCSVLRQQGKFNLEE